MNSGALHYPHVEQIAVPGFIVLILVEFGWIAWTGRGRYETRDALTSLIMGAGNVAAGMTFGFITWHFYLLLWKISPLNLGHTWSVVFICFVLDDFRYYWAHRLAHRCRWVWASHVNHHSSQHYNLTTALRQPWTATFTGIIVLSGPLILLGFNPALVLFVQGVNLLYQFWIHTEAIDKLPRWFEAIMNTPSHHRVHHGRNPRYLDRNYGGVFIVWDRIFRTFVAEQERDKPQYGLVHNLGTFNPLRVAFHEWLAIAKDITLPGLSLRQRMMYCVAAPGWSHNRSRRTSDRLRADEPSIRPLK